MKSALSAALVLVWLSCGTVCPCDAEPAAAPKGSSAATQPAQKHPWELNPYLKTGSSGQSKTTVAPISPLNQTPDGPFVSTGKDKNWHPIEVVGEVVDTWCFASGAMGAGRGEQHKACALACAHGGVTIGIVDDKGTLYIAAKSKGFNGCKELLTPFMAKRVKAVGWAATKGGCNVMKVSNVAEVK